MVTLDVVYLLEESNILRLTNIVMSILFKNGPLPLISFYCTQVFIP